MEPPILQTLGERLQPGHTALLIVDMQKDFAVEGFATHRAGRDLTATRAIIPSLQRLLGAAREAEVAVVHVGFWTLAAHGSDSGPWLAQRRRATYSSDAVALAGTEGADFIDELMPRPGELVVRKHRYSAFKGTDLDMVLRARSVRSVVVCGVSTNVCVESTLRDAFETGYYVALPRDAAASWNSALHEATLQTVEHRFGLVTDAASVTEIWRRAGAGRAAAE
ncbi:MAG: cysteine hydrolase family protein [Rhodospirillales bacterium]